MNRLICRIFGHKTGPWERLVLLDAYFTHDCSRCKAHRVFSGDGWYTEFHNKKLTKKGCL